MPGADRDGLTAGPADRLQAVGGAIVALDSGLGHMSEYTGEMRALRERRVGIRVAAIFAGHERLPIKRLSYDEVICGHIKCSRSVERLKQYVLRDPELKASDLHAREDEFDFIMTKLLRSVGLNGTPTAQQITEDAAFLLIVVRPEFYERNKTGRSPSSSR